MQWLAVNHRTPEHSEIILRKFQPQNTFRTPETKYTLFFSAVGKNLCHVPDFLHCEKYNDETI